MELAQEPTQRLTLLGFHVWLVVIMRGIELGRISKADEALIHREDEAGQTATTI